MEVEKDTLEHIEEEMLSWYEHVRRTDPNEWITKITEWRRKRGRPRRSFRNEIAEAMEK